MIYIIAGNSGSGKTTQANALTHLGIQKIITYTTRPPRPFEVHGKDYYFVDRESFLEKDGQNAFIGTTNYLGNYYSTLREDLNRCYSQGKDCVIVVDEKGIEAIKKDYPKAICIYLHTDPHQLKHRMEARGDSPAKIQQRLSYLSDFKGLYDYKVDANDDSDQVYEKVVEIIRDTGGLSHKNQS